MKGRSQFSVLVSMVTYALKANFEIQVHGRKCDFCETPTPGPTEEQLELAARMLNQQPLFSMNAAVEGEEGIADGGYSSKGTYLFRCKGWERLGPRSWACPECVKKAEAALGDPK